MSYDEAMKAREILALGVLASSGIAASPQGAEMAPSVGDRRPSIVPIESPAGTDTAQPQLTVSPRGALLSWIETSGPRAALKFAERTATGWSPPRTAATGTDWFVNWADVPSVLRLDDGTLVAHWLQRNGPDTYAYDVRLAYSRDDGQTWSPSFTPHHDGLPREHGFASLFQMPGEGLGLIWLDGRAMAPSSGHDSHAASAGAMSVRFGTFDASWTQTSEMPIDLRVCECCPTSAAMTSEGPIVAYRNRADDEIRDIYVARLAKGAWTSPTPVHDDHWRIAACPVNGPRLSARGRAVVLAWFTVRDQVGHAYAAFSTDAGRSFGQPIQLDDTASIGRVGVALLPDGSAAATWIEFAGQRSSFAVRRIQPSGQRSPAIAVAPVEGARSSGYPRLAWAADELVFAWTERANGAFRVRTARLSAPVRAVNSKASP